MRTAAFLLRVPALIAACSLVLAGCKVGPDFERPAAPDVTTYTPDPLPAETTSSKIANGEAQRFVTGADLPGQWWQVFHSASLDELIAQALKANPNLQAAQAALRQAEENTLAAGGALYPNIGLNASETRERLSGVEFGRPGTSSVIGIATAQVNISYTLDIFGGIRRTIEASEAQTEFERFQLEAAYLTLTSGVVLAAIQEASLRGQIVATEAIIASEAQELSVLQKQFELGGASKAAVLAQEATLAQFRATLPPLQKQLSQQRNLLAVLVGQPPSRAPSQRFELASMKLPEDLPLSLPSALVEQRPDIRAAEAQLHEASAQVGVATANMLPQITLTAGGGSIATGVSNLFSPGTAVWSVAGNVLQPLFDAGTLLHQKRAAEAAFDQAAAQYQATVLTSFQNVADTLRALQSDADALKAQVASESAAGASLNLTRDQFRAGAVPYVALLTAEQTYQQAKLALVQAEANRFADTAALFQALGGGWWHRNDSPRPLERHPEEFLPPPLAVALPEEKPR
jgi:NodT family efflux transporter outer membrane factor (OMF) lipoprotein